MSIRVFVPGDAGALAVGADSVAASIERVAAERGASVEIVRNGSRGLYWLEPLVEVATASGRIAYGPVEAGDVAQLFDDGFLEGKPGALFLGPTEDIPFLKRQTRLTFARCGVIDPRSLDDYRAHGGYRGLAKAVALAPTESITRVKTSGLRGRGGAGPPAQHRFVHQLRDAPAIQEIPFPLLRAGQYGAAAVPRYLVP
jgi:formate dehydrogenase iron-sulfur subunit